MVFLKAKREQAGLVTTVSQLERGDAFTNTEDGLALYDEDIGSSEEYVAEKPVDDRQEDGRTLYWERWYGYTPVDEILMPVEHIFSNFFDDTKIFKRRAVERDKNPYF